MCYWVILLSYLFTIANTQPKEKDDFCKQIECIGEEYQCLNNHCYCAPGFIINKLETSCVKCPGLGEKCYRTCCENEDNGSLYCWQGICRQCTDEFGNWICREPIDQAVIVSISQIAMATALVLGILATFVLLYKLCVTTTVSAFGGPSSSEAGRLSIGSLQLHVNERLRDAPPRYSRAAPAGASVYPAACFLNAGFVHDSSLPPPPYTPSPDRKNVVDTSHINTEIHM